MTAKKVQLRIVTPTKVKLDEKADMVIMRCIDGDMGIMPGHEARSVVLDYGILRIIDNDGKERKIAVFGGFAEIHDNILTVLTHDAEWPEDVDIERAKADHENAQRRIQERTDDMELHKDQILLRRALVRMEVSSYNLLNESGLRD